MTYISSSSRTDSAPGIGRIHTDAASSVRSQQEDIRAGTAREADRAELSPIAKFLSELKTGAPVREDLVARVKNEIQAGTYDTDAKFDAILNDVVEDITFEL